MNREILSAALCIRSAAVKIAPSVDIDPQTLSGFCAVCSSALISEIPSAVFVGGMFDNFGHCWVMIENTILDITADQFGFNEILFVRPWEPLRARYQARVIGSYGLEVAKTKQFQKELFERLPNNWWRVSKF